MIIHYYFNFASDGHGRGHADVGGLATSPLLGHAIKNHCVECGIKILLLQLEQNKNETTTRKLMQHLISVEFWYFKQLEF